MSTPMPDDLRDACKLAADAAYYIAREYAFPYAGIGSMPDESLRDQLTDAIETQLAVWFAKHEAERATTLKSP